LVLRCWFQYIKIKKILSVQTHSNLNKSICLTTKGWIRSVDAMAIFANEARLSLTSLLLHQQVLKGLYTHWLDQWKSSHCTYFELLNVCAYYWVGFRRLSLNIKHWTFHMMHWHNMKILHNVQDIIIHKFHHYYSHTWLYKKLKNNNEKNEKFIKNIVTNL
jgi:hypothetical protein